MGGLFLLSQRQMARIAPSFPLAHGVSRVDDRRLVSRIVYVIRNGLQWKDAPKEYGPHKTLYNRFMRWSRLGVFDRIFAALAGEGPKPKRIMIDATHLRAHRTAAGLLKRDWSPPSRAHQRRPELQAPCRLRRRWQADHPAGLNRVPAPKM
jgi:transposase